MASAKSPLGTHRAWLLQYIYLPWHYTELPLGEIPVKVGAERKDWLNMDVIRNELSRVIYTRVPNTRSKFGSTTNL